MTHHEIKQWLL